MQNTKNVPQQPKPLTPAELLAIKGGNTETTTGIVIDDIIGI